MKKKKILFLILFIVGFTSFFEFLITSFSCMFAKSFVKNIFNVEEKTSIITSVSPVIEYDGSCSFVLIYVADEAYPIATINHQLENGDVYETIHSGDVIVYSLTSFQTEFDNQICHQASQITVNNVDIGFPKKSFDFSINIVFNTLIIILIVLTLSFLAVGIIFLIHFIKVLKEIHNAQQT